MNLIRKVSVLVLMLCALLTSAQQKSITINVANETLEKVLAEINHQSGYNFIFNDENISPKSEISFSGNSMAINAIMDEIAKMLNVDYDVVGKTIILKPKTNEISEISDDNFLLRQNIRGKVVDKVSHSPLFGANVILLDFKPTIATITDENGEFVLENVAVGRHNIYVSYIGYQPAIINGVMLNSAKEQYLNISLEQSIETLGEITVRPTIRKDRPANTMATVSARSFSVEESQRYAGGVGDPTRMASAFAGVASGYNLEDNSITVRGNRPGAIVWRVEDVDVPNPNHFAGAYVAGAGFACLISNQLMDNSDFFTGAFPAQYGNSLGAAFDLKLRTGNNQQREYAFQAGVLGIDFASEGPFVKGKSASYNINYRYSTLGLLNDIGIIPDNVAPRYQDLSFKLNFPTKKLGTFTLWGIGGVDYQKLDLDTDSTNWEWDDQRSREEIYMNMGSIALAHKKSIGSKTFIKTSFVASGMTGEGKNDWIQNDLSITKDSRIFMQNGTLTLSSFLNTRLGKRVVNRTGFNVNQLYYNIDLNTSFDHNPASYINYAKSRNSSSLLQVFTQTKVKISSTLNLNLGVYTQYFALNKNYTIEPRVGLAWNVNNKHTLSLGYGNHSQMEELRFYFIKDTASGVGLVNKNLEFARAHHFVIGYDYSVTDYFRIKVEPYYQYLYNYPGVPNSGYSMINFEQDWEFMGKLENNSRGENIGVDVTVEQFLHRNYYFLVTASIFDSKYTGDDGVERNTRYDKGYVVNGLVGKEFHRGENGNNILSVNVRGNLFGGNRTTPLDWEASYQQLQTVEDDSQLFEDKNPFRLYFDLTVRYRINKEKYTHIWSLEILNVLPVFSKRTYYSYNTEMKDFKKYSELSIIVPFVSYKLEF